MKMANHSAHTAVTRNGEIALVRCAIEENGLPGIYLTGAFKEYEKNTARETVRSAITQSGFIKPLGRIVVDVFEPDGIRKIKDYCELESSIALAILSASEQMRALDDPQKKIHASAMTIFGELLGYSETGDLKELVNLVNDENLDEDRLIEEFREKTKDGYTVLEINDRGDALIFRGMDSYEPFIIAHGYDAMDGTWSQGTYYSDLNDAYLEYDPPTILGYVLTEDDLAEIKWSVAKDYDYDTLKEVIDQRFELKHSRDDMIAEIIDDIDALHVGDKELTPDVDRDRAAFHLGDEKTKSNHSTGRVR